MLPRKMTMVAHARHNVVAAAVLRGGPRWRRTILELWREAWVAACGAGHVEVG